MPYLPIDPADLGQNYEAVIRVNSQSGKGGIAYLIKQYLHLDVPRRMQIAFYSVVQAVSDREAREMTVEDITTAFRQTYHYGGGKHEGRLGLRSFTMSSVPDPTGAASAEDLHMFDGAVTVDGQLRVIRGDGNGPISSLLDALSTSLHIDLALRELNEHPVEAADGQPPRAAAYVELVPPTDRKSVKSWWGVGVDRDSTTAKLRAVLSAVNAHIEDRPLPELKLSVGFNARSDQSDVASALLNILGVQLPRSLQAVFFEVVQRKARETEGVISYDELAELFRATYGWKALEGMREVELKSFNLEHLPEKQIRLNGELALHGETRKVEAIGNGPLSASLACLNAHLEGTLSIREYSEHSLGEGTEVLAASYVELLYEKVDEKGQSVRKFGWGVASDTDIAASGLKAVMAAASRVGADWCVPKVNGA